MGPGPQDSEFLPKILMTRGVWRLLSQACWQQLSGGPTLCTWAEVFLLRWAQGG